MDNVKLSTLTPAQYQFLESKKAEGFYDHKTREYLYALIDKLESQRKANTRAENRLRERFKGIEFGILLPEGQKSTGRIKFKSSLCVNGVHEGDIITGGTLIINSQGSVYGNLRAEEVICKGRLAGDVAAEKKLTVYSTGSMLGDVVAPSIQIAPGALFKGKCKLGTPVNGTRTNGGPGEDALPSPAGGIRDLSRAG